MWKQYQKTLIPIQIIIFAACAFLFFTGRVAGPAILIVFVVMQIAAVLGAAWGARLRRKMEAGNERLPLR